jgi:hypothetical protein
MPLRCVTTIPASIASSKSSWRNSSRFLSILQHLGLGRDVGPRCVAIAAARAASIADRQRGSSRAGSRHLAVGSRPRFELPDVGPAAIKMLLWSTGSLGSSFNLAAGPHVGQRTYGISTGTGSLELSVILFCPEIFTSNSTSETATPSEHDAITRTFRPSSCSDLTVHF